MSSNLKVFALGGLHEVGKNCYVLEKNEDIIIVDCGVKFLNNNNLADGTIPNFTYLLENREKIKGLFITHGHEDHIGGIAYLLQLIPNIPIYGSEFSISLLKSKLRGEEKEKAKIFREDDVIETSEFRVGFFRVTHSIPGSFGLIVEVLREDREEEKKFLNLMKRDNISKITLIVFSGDETRWLKRKIVLVDSERNKKVKEVVFPIHWELIIDYENSDTKTLTSLQSETFFSNFSNLKVIEVKNYLQRVKRNSIIRQELDTLLFNVRIVITGDFKFDWTEIGEKFDLTKLAEAGQKGVDLLLSDSTNAEVEGNTPSETRVINRLENIIIEAKGRTIITSFASNVYRLKKVIEIAKKANKKIVLLGSSLLRMMKAIQKASLWKIDNSVFLEAEDIAKTPNNKLIIFCTGSQGEEKAVLGRLAHQNYPGWKVAVGDSIILTSSPIMDNRSQVEKNNNKLFALGAKIYENSKEDLLHASGHACQEDLKLMLKLVNPTYFMPFHGDFRMLKKHGHLAQELGLAEKNIFVCQNGEVVEARGKEFFLSKAKVPAQPNYVLNGKLLSARELNSNLELREKMSHGGVILVILFYDEKKRKLVNSPYLFTYGFINMKKSENLINGWKNKIDEYIKKNEGKENWGDEIKNYLERELLRNWNKEKPLVHTIVEYKQKALH